MPDVESRLTDLEQQVQALTENQDAIIADAAKVPDSLALNFRILTRSIDAKFAAHDRKIDRLQEDVSGLKADVSGLKADVSGLKTDVRGLKTDVKDLKTDVSDLKTDVAAILKILGGQFRPKT
jgi:peptidoglycan hydrolase CwlO-like protein